MLDFGDEFVIENYRVPWLIWLQLIVMILLVLVLLCGFGIFALDRSGKSTSNGASSSSSQSHGKDPLRDNISSKVERNQRIPVEAEASASKVMIEDEIQEREESSAKDIALSRVLRQGGHPCDYFGLARQAFLKCFGLGYTSESRRRSKHRKED